MSDPSWKVVASFGCTVGIKVGNFLEQTLLDGKIGWLRYIFQFSLYHLHSILQFERLVGYCQFSLYHLHSIFCNHIHWPYQHPIKDIYQFKSQFCLPIWHKSWKLPQTNSVGWNCHSSLHHLHSFFCYPILWHQGYL